MAQAQPPLGLATSVPETLSADIEDVGRDRSHTFPTISIQSDGNKKMRMSLSKEKMFVKVLLLGETQTGKSALIRKFIHEEFLTTYHRTVGVDVQSRNCDVPIEIIEELDEEDGWIPSMPSFDELSREALQPSPPSSLGINSVGSHHSSPSGGSGPFGMNVKKTSAVVNVRLKIVDAGVYALGQENSEKDLSGVAGVILVVDLSNRETLEALPHWVRFIQENVIDRRRSVKLKNESGKSGKHFKDELAIIIAANKYDVTDTRAFSMSDLERYCADTVYPALRELNASSLDLPQTIRIGNGAPSRKARKGADRNKLNTDFQIVPTSAKTGYNVEHIFESVLQRILPKRLEASSHSRTRTTAQIRAPIWLRQLALGMGDDEPTPVYASSDEDDFEYSQHDGDELEDDGMMLGQS